MVIFKKNIILSYIMPRNYRKYDNYIKMYGKNRGTEIKLKISNTLKSKPKKDMEYIKEKLKNYKINTKTDCWLWNGATTNFGHGRIKINNKFFSVHRLSYIIHIGKIPKELFVCHHCDNPSCINPQHLFIGTRSDNMKDAYNKGRLKIPHNKGENVPGHILTEKDVKKIIKIKHTQKITDSELGKKFRVARQTINGIINNEKWKHINRNNI
jgi:hypothetical protein